MADGFQGCAMPSKFHDQPGRMGNTESRPKTNTGQYPRASRRTNTGQSARSHRAGQQRPPPPLEGVRQNTPERYLPQHDLQALLERFFYPRVEFGLEVLKSARGPPEAGGGVEQRAVLTALDAAKERPVDLCRARAFRACRRGATPGRSSSCTSCVLVRPPTDNSSQEEIR